MTRAVLPPLTELETRRFLKNGTEPEIGDIGMSSKNDGGPVFPCEAEIEVPHTSDPETGDVWSYTKEIIISPGMSLRDYLAAQSLHAMDLKLIDETSVSGFDQKLIQDGRFRMARAAYQMADAMLVARDA